jgi:hypothetical protein
MTSSLWGGDFPGENQGCSEAIDIGLGSSRLHYQPDQVEAPVNSGPRVHWRETVYGPRHGLYSPKCREGLITCIKTFFRVASCRSVVKWAILFMRPMQWHVKDRWTPHIGLEVPIMVTQVLESHLQWWLHQPNLEWDLILQPPVQDPTVTTDACPEGWGAFSMVTWPSEFCCSITGLRKTLACTSICWNSELFT